MKEEIYSYPISSKIVGYTTYHSYKCFNCSAIIDGYKPKRVRGRVLCEKCKKAKYGTSISSSTMSWRKEVVDGFEKYKAKTIDDVYKAGWNDAIDAYSSMVESAFLHTKFDITDVEPLTNQLKECNGKK